ncbi:hypothetical protein ACFQ3L_00710 [Lacticaseibacillus jixianensis]|uniref:Uncharacterized protein n=1 Tax=Lacticaseibacillus jixianensis TaxID=2486012 RepID=A0ABW4B606_9LACO|nr:hypothetical protein [Lacticaseibacillus jixianensis]
MMSAGFGIKRHYHTHRIVRWAATGSRRQLAAAHARAFDRVAATPVGGVKVALGALALVVVLVGVLGATL